jgi:hypothetical protein
MSDEKAIRELLRTSELLVASVNAAKADRLMGAEKIARFPLWQEFEAAFWKVKRALVAIDCTVEPVPDPSPTPQGG